MIGVDRVLDAAVHHHAPLIRPDRVTSPLPQPVGAVYPTGFAHGFQTLTDDAEVLYHISERYRSEAQRGVRWDDPDLAIAWPKTEQRVMSGRDHALPRLRDLSPTFSAAARGCKDVTANAKI